MAINPNQISVAKIYPGNYTNVLRYWHEEKSVVYNNENGTSETLTNQPIGGPVGVIFRPGWVAQQAVGYVDLSYQNAGSNNQLDYYTQPYGSGLNGTNQPFKAADIIIPSPDAYKDVRADITDGITVPSGAYIYRVSVRVDGGDVITSGIAGAQTSPGLGVGPALSSGLTTAPSPSGFFANIVGSNSRIENGTFNSSNAWNGGNMHVVTSDTKYRLYSTATVPGSGLGLGSGVYDPRAKANSLSGKDKALGICEVCWLVPDEAPKRQDLALQPAGIIESNVYTSTVPQ
jgi:hypothetical protein